MTADPDRLLHRIREAFNQHYQGNPVDLDQLAADWEALDQHMIRSKEHPPSDWPPYN
ncbi:hypothetical protein [Lentzea aerocolonigenes]|uniref:hypothetical protein n=1 Tax=Lentzea aerocolonigenes TaxID=68170 RepID=UPI000AAE49E7|nr:hypothetical protein [Lentzea aerocolonigenes]MCP2248171.1 hypothetical protein [Lentzea aerocolonigenes]